MGPHITLGRYNNNPQYLDSHYSGPELISSRHQSLGTITVRPPTKHGLRVPSERKGYRINCHIFFWLSQHLGTPKTVAFIHEKNQDVHQQTLRTNWIKLYQATPLGHVLVFVMDICSVGCFQRIPRQLFWVACIPFPLSCGKLQLESIMIPLCSYLLNMCQILK